MIYAGLVQTREHVEPRWVIMIPMNAEYRQLNAERCTQVIRSSILESLELPLGELRVSENLLVKDLGRLVTKKDLAISMCLLSLSGRFLVMKEVAPEQHYVHLPLIRTIKGYSTVTYIWRASLKA